MIKEYYGLKSDPFRLSPDHNFCYRYPSFAKGRAYMQYALQAAEGFVVVTGSPGMGKTTLINDLLADYGSRDYTVATLVNTMLEANEVLRSAAYEFGLNVENMDTATVLQRLKQRFTLVHNDGRPPLLVVDEAQNLTLNALEELRMLTNLQTDGKPLLQIFLVGQEELRAKLQDPGLEQLRQRVTAAAHLHALDRDQTAAYIIHRLKVVGWKGFPKLKSSLLPIIEAACEGVPRRINQFCSRLLLHGAVEQKSELNAQDARLVLGELSDERLSHVPTDMNNGSGSQMDEADSDLGEGPGFSDMDLQEDPNEVRAQQKNVMPPPQLREPPLPRDKQPTMPANRVAKPRQPDRSEAEPLVPTMDEAYNAPNAGHPRAELPPLEDTIEARRPFPPGPDRGPRHRRRRGRNWLGRALLFGLLTGVAVYAWYRFAPASAEEVLGDRIDAYLSALQDGIADGAGNRAGVPDLPPPDAPDATGPSSAEPRASAETRSSLR